MASGYVQIMGQVTQNTNLLSEIRLLLLKKGQHSGHAAVVWPFLWRIPGSIIEGRGIQQMQGKSLVDKARYNPAKCEALE